MNKKHFLNYHGLDLEDDLVGALVGGRLLRITAIRNVTVCIEHELA